jgi:hypothetical protein
MFEITQKGRAYIDAATRPTGGCAPWVRARWNPVRRACCAPSLPHAA